MSVRKKEQLIRLSRRDCDRYELNKFRRSERQQVRMALEDICKDTDSASDFRLPDLQRPWYHRHRYTYDYRAIRKLLMGFIDRPWVEAHQYICKNFKPENRSWFFDNVYTKNEIEARSWSKIETFVIDDDGYLRYKRREPYRVSRDWNNYRAFSKLPILAGWLNGRCIFRAGAILYFGEPVYDGLFSLAWGREIKWGFVLEDSKLFAAHQNKDFFRQGNKLSEEDMEFFLYFHKDVRDLAIVNLERKSKSWVDGA